MISKFRLPNYQDTDKEAVKANKQTFTKYSPTYVYNEDTKELKRAMNDETGEFYDKDDQAYIDSFANTALDKVLERFLPQDYDKVVTPLSDEQFSDSQQVGRDLSDYSAILDHAEDLREKYGLDSDMSCIDVFNYVDQLNTRYKDKIDGYIKAKSEKQVPVDNPRVTSPAEESPKVEQIQIDYDQLAQSILSKTQGGQNNA